jgi:hypothetical protein
MGLREWAGRTRSRVRDEGLRGVTDGAYELYGGLWRHLGWHVPRGTNVYDRDWDTLVVLDACRVDVLREVADEYPFVEAVESVTSVGSMSEELLAKTFTDAHADERRDTAYVTANVFSDRVLSAGQLAVLDEVWRYAWDDDLGTVPPRPVTDRAVAVARDRRPGRLVVHYMQPHHPFVGETTVDGVAADPFGREGRTTALDALRRGEVTRDAVWAAYRSNLRAVLDDVAVLLANHDAERVVLTADHGEGFGEWGIYDHPAGCLHPAVTNVPWVETTAVDSGEFEPELEPDADGRADVEERLRGLGYR